MRVHHLNCVSMCPPGGRLMDGANHESGPAQLSCHCLLIELEDRLVLVDTGFGVRDVEMPRRRLSGLFLNVLCRPRLRVEDTAVHQLRVLGFRPRDVSDILLTHLDFDHAGGLDDFPAARVHLMAPEVSAADRRETWLDRQRFRPEQWGSLQRWVTYEAQGEPWFGFDAVRDLQGLPPEILLVPLVGHTLGHAGIAVHTDDGRWLLHAGDAYFYYGEMEARRHCPPGLRLYQTFMEKDRRLRMKNQRRLRELARHHRSEVTVFCAHDMRELRQLQAWPAEAPREVPVTGPSPARPEGPPPPGPA